MASSRRFSPERVIFMVAVLMVVSLNLHLSGFVQDMPQSFPLPDIPRGKPITLKKPSPIFVVGLPKAGTSSIHAMFECSGIRSSHYCCCGSNRTHTHCNDGGKSFAQCMGHNIKNGRPILENCGNYTVYAQMDSELGNSIFLPQRFKLDLLHDYAPNATFILNVRPAEEWVKSVSNWFGLGGRFLNLFKIDPKKVARYEVLKEIFNNHTQFIRDFVQVHPSHSLVEVDISHSSAGTILADSFGLIESCWGRHNENKKRKST